MGQIIMYKPVLCARPVFWAPGYCRCSLLFGAVLSQSAINQEERKEGGDKGRAYVGEGEHICERVSKE